MENLNPSIFIVPTIALTATILFYFYFHKKVDDKQKFRQFFWRVVFFAYLFNLVWELAQGPLYEGYVYDLSHMSFCALASVADVFMVLLLYFGFAVLYKDFFWVRTPTIGKILPVIIAGGLGAIFAETQHTAAGNWAYADAMPLLPIVEVGLAPVLQFMILPTLTYWLSWKLLNTDIN